MAPEYITSGMRRNGVSPDNAYDLTLADRSPSKSDFAVGMATSYLLGCEFRGNFGDAGFERLELAPFDLTSTAGPRA
jgi:hypothetical protein